MLCVQGYIAPLLSHSQALVDGGSHTSRAAVGVMLLNRVLSIGAAVAIALLAVVVLRGERGTAFQERPGHPSARSLVTTPADDP